VTEETTNTKTNDNMTTTKIKTMKTLTTITFIGGNTERKKSFIRLYSAKKPTYLGAARMIAAKLNAENDSGGEYPAIKPSDISVSRIEYCDYQAN
jgi:hypothetical protein